MSPCLYDTHFARIRISFGLYLLPSHVKPCCSDKKYDPLYGRTGLRDVQMGLRFVQSFIVPERSWPQASFFLSTSAHGHCSYRLVLRGLRSHFRFLFPHPVRCEVCSGGTVNNLHCLKTPQSRNTKQNQGQFYSLTWRDSVTSYNIDINDKWTTRKCNRNTSVAQCKRA